MSLPPSSSHPLFKIISGSLVLLPTPSNISSAWNFGSILGLCLITQILTGLFLAMQYTPNVSAAFYSVATISADINYGWLLRAVHANGASVFFMAVYCHLGRGLYFNSSRLVNTWLSGVGIIFALMVIAFLGYVLPWGQMSFWGATVITNLISAIPYAGQSIVYWLWGGFSVGGATLTRFFTLHFTLPFVLMVLVVLHLVSLHETGSSNPLGINSNHDKLPFHPYFSSKDTVGWVVMLAWMLTLALYSPWLLGDSENFLSANPMVTPVHIKPEWYFLFAYAILRSIPNKLGGVLALVMAIGILAISPLISQAISFNSPARKALFWGLVGLFMVLTWIGGKPVEDPYILIGQLASGLYFIFFLAHGSA